RSRGAGKPFATPCDAQFVCKYLLTSSEAVGAGSKWSPVEVPFGIETGKPAPDRIVRPGVAVIGDEDARLRPFGECQIGDQHRVVEHPKGAVHDDHQRRVITNAKPDRPGIKTWNQKSDYEGELQADHRPV